MTLAERVAMIRAEEQVQAAHKRGKWQRDSAEIVGPAPRKPTREVTTCTAEGCDRRGDHRGMCPKHYAQWRKERSL